MQSRLAAVFALTKNTITRPQGFQLLPYLLRTENDKKPPSGFEKFIKKTREKKEQAEAKKEQDDPEKTKPEEEIEKPKKRPSIQERLNRKQEKKEEKSDGDKEGFRNFMPSGGGGPNFLFLASLMGFSFLYLISTYKQANGKEITYMDFVNQYLTKNKIKMISVSQDKSNETFQYKAEIECHDGEKVYLVLPQIDNFLYKLDLVQREMGKQPSDFVPLKFSSENPQDGNNNIMTLLMLGMCGLFMYQVYKGSKGTGPKKKGDNKGKEGGMFGGGGGMGDMFNVGKSNATVYGVDKKIKTKFRHVAGMENAKQEVQEFVDFLKAPEKYTKLGAKTPRGALLSGPPGTGKTLLAKAIAGEAGVPFFSISGSDFVEMFVGVGASRVRDLFKKAKEKSPSIIFIDEIDAVAKKRHGKFGGNDERDNTLNQLLVEMDGFDTDSKVIVLAATNRVDILDKAILRPGRFDRQIEITKPTINEREKIYNVHLKKIKLNPDLTRSEYAKKIAALTPGFSGAEIANVCNEAAIIAARKNLKDVGIIEFESATERVIGGIEKKSIMTVQERRTVAYHEAGHAVAGWFLQNSNPLLKVTIIPRSKGSLGFAQYLPDELSLYTKEQLIDMIRTALGGRIAEEIFFDKITTGASDDIKKVTNIAKSLVMVYGMTPEIGLVSYAGGEEQQVQVYSEETHEMIDEAVKRVVDDCYASTKELLIEKKHLIEKQVIFNFSLAELLLKKESINLPDIVDTLGERPFPMKETMRQYLEELRERDKKETVQKEKEEEQLSEKEEEDEAKAESEKDDNKK